MADIELFQGEVSPIIYISPPEDGETNLDAAWECKLGVYDSGDVVQLSRTVTNKEMSDIDPPIREHFSTYFTEAETAALDVGEYTIAIAVYQTVSEEPPKYRQEKHLTLKVNQGFIDF